MRFHKTDTQTLRNVDRIDQEIALATNTGVGITSKSYTAFYQFLVSKDLQYKFTLQIRPDAIFH